MADLDPKVTLLRHKLALVMGEEHCPVYSTVKLQQPNALDEAWSSTMSEPYTLVVFNNKTFAMRQASSHAEAYGRSFQPDPIDCGENIKLYLDDNLFRDQKQAITIDYTVLQRYEGLATRALKSKWYFWLTGWVDKINGGLGKVSRTGKMESKIKSKIKSNMERKNGEQDGKPDEELEGQ